MPTKTEIRKANQPTLREWMHEVFEDDPENPIDEMTNDVMREALLDVEDFVTEPDASDDGGDEDGDEGEGAEPEEDLSRPNPRTDLYSGKIRSR